MRYRELRRLLQQIVLAGLPVTAGGCVEAVLDNDCVDTHERSFELEIPEMADDPALKFKIDRCRVDAAECDAVCVEAMERNNVQSSPKTCTVEFRDPTVDVSVTYEVYDGGGGCPVEGRRPAGLSAPRSSGGTARSATGAWLAQAAWLEAASIHAFVHLARELEAHGAPAALVRWALISAADEVRHTRAVAQLAARYGAFPSVPQVAPPAPRSLEALAIENAAEGCVRETWGAAIAEWQSRAAPDPEVRAVFAAIARDEARHAALAWAVDRWVRTRLDDSACARIDAAREAALRELATETPGIPAEALGLPEGPQARGLYARAFDTIWNGGRTCHA